MLIVQMVESYCLFHTSNPVLRGMSIKRGKAEEKRYAQMRQDSRCKKETNGMNHSVAVVQSEWYVQVGIT